MWARRMYFRSAGKEPKFIQQLYSPNTFPGTFSVVLIEQFPLDRWIIFSLLSEGRQEKWRRCRLNPSVSKVVLDEPLNGRSLLQTDPSYGDESDFEKTAHSCVVDDDILLMIVIFLSVFDDRKDSFSGCRINAGVYWIPTDEENGIHYSTNQVCLKWRAITQKRILRTSLPLCSSVTGGGSYLPYW